MPPDGKLAEVLRLAELGDIIDGILDTVCCLVLALERIDSLQAYGQEYRVKVPAQAFKRDPLAQRLAVLDGNAADGKDEVDLGLGEVVHCLVRGDAVFIEAARLFARLVDGHVMTMHGKTVSAGEAGGPRPNYGHMFPG